jgi:DAK2 domain fusion protein YloV
MATLERMGAAAVRDTISQFRNAVNAHAAAINRLNVYPVPDGDTGTNMARTLDAVVAEVDGALEGPDQPGAGTSDSVMTVTCKAISHGSLMGARGNSGVILSQILRGIAGVFQAVGEVGGATVAEALEAASTKAYQAVLKPIEGTILTVVREAAGGAAAAASAGADLLGVLDAARVAGQIALDHTPDQLPVLRDAGVVDAGGAGFLLLLDAALHVVDGRAMPEPELVDGPIGAAFDKVAHRGDGDISDLRYEVMYFLDLADERIEAFKHGWGEIGDSIVVVGGDGLWNCHVHTNDVGAALEVALDLDGRPRKIRVTDLFEEVEAEHAIRERSMRAGGAAAFGLPPVTTAVVAVTAGDGLVELFGQLGVQGVVTGGQTMNPSTAELLSAVEAVNAQQVVILPNNKNIIPVAQQVDALTSKKVLVVPTRSMPEALAALVVLDPEASAEDNAAGMTAAAESVATGEVTQAVRDAGSPAGPVRVGDWIGLRRGDGIVAVSGSLVSASCALLDDLCAGNREIVTIIEGVDATADHTAALRAWLADNHPDLAVEVHRGGQPLYPYLFGVE